MMGKTKAKQAILHLIKEQELFDATNQRTVLFGVCKEKVIFLPLFIVF